MIKFIWVLVLCAIISLIGEYARGEEVTGNHVAQSMCEYHLHYYPCLLMEAHNEAFIVISKHDAQNEIHAVLVYKLVVKDGKVLIVVYFEQGEAI